MNGRYKVMAGIIILLAVVGLAFLIDTAVQLITGDSHKVTNIDDLMERLYGD